MGHLLMSKKERERLVEMKRVKEREVSIRAVAERLGISYRQGRRIYQRYGKEGEAGLCHRSRGRRSNRSKSREFRAAVLKQYQEEFGGLGPTLAAEKFQARGQAVDHETLRRWLLEAGLRQVERKRSPYRSWRQRRARWGELVQFDGSPHAWLGGEQKQCLMNLVDDATGRVYAQLFEAETIVAAMRTLWDWIERYGVPHALYTDHKNVYLTGREATLEEQLRGEVPRTAFGQACHRLGIVIIGANSPQAKGRVERSNGVFQDRLVKELAWNGITTLEGANAYLKADFLKHLNQMFEKVARDGEDAHRPLPEGVKLEEVFVLEQTRQVQRDWTVHYQNRLLQIWRQTCLPPAKSKVLVQERLDGSLHLFYRGNRVEYQEVLLPGPLLLPAEAPVVVTVQQGLKRKHRPSPDHPWRRPFLRPLAAIPASRNKEGSSTPPSPYSTA